MSDDWSLKGKITPAMVHVNYLEACKEISPENYNQKAQRQYSALTTEQQFIDVYLSSVITGKMERLRKAILADVDEARRTKRRIPLANIINRRFGVKP